MPVIQPIHLILILIIALVIFGPSRLPELGRSLGKSITEFKDATRDLGRTVEPIAPPAGMPSAPVPPVAPVVPTPAVEQPGAAQRSE